MQAYNAEEFITADELKKRIGEARAMKHRLRFDLMRETNRIDKEELEDVYKRQLYVPTGSLKGYFWDFPIPFVIK